MACGIVRLNAEMVYRTTGPATLRPAPDARRTRKGVRVPTSYVTACLRDQPPGSAERKHAARTDAIDAAVHSVLGKARGTHVAAQ